MLDYTNPHVLDLVFDICSYYGVDPFASKDLEAYFDQLALHYQGSTDLESIRQWLDAHLKQHFRALHDRPHWLQSEEWPIIGGIPALFIGQLNIPWEGVSSDIFHDTTAFYVFMPKNEPPLVIMQQM